jgi:hypothetical protein
LLPALLLLLTAETAAAQYLHPQFQSGERNVHTVLLLPPRVYVQKEGMKGADAMFKESEEVRDSLSAMVSTVLREKRLNVMELPPPTAGRGGDELKYLLADMQDRYDRIGRLLDNKPKDVRKGRFSLGDEVSVLDPDDAADALVFIRASGTRLTKWRRASEVFVLGAHLWSEITISLAVVDSKTGEVLYFAKCQAKGDFVGKTDQVLLQPLQKALRDLPAPASRGDVVPKSP